MDVAIIRQGELVGRGMMAYETTEEVGVVEHLLVNVQQAKVVGLSYKTLGLIGRRQHLDWTQLVKIGKDRIVVQAEIAEAVDSRLSAAQDMTDLEVWTDGGDLIGRIVDICLDQSSGQIEQYLFALKGEGSESGEVASKEIAGKEIAAEPIDKTAVLYGEEVREEVDEPAQKVATSVYAIEPRVIISAGRKRMMIAEEDAQRLQPYHQLLNLPPKQSAEPLRSNWKPDQISEMPTDFGELLKKGQSLAGQVGERMREQAKRLAEGSESEELPEITEQLQEKTEQVKLQMQKQFQRARERAKAQIDNQGLEEKLGKTAFGRVLGKTFSKLNPQNSDLAVDPIDVESFEVWEEDEANNGE
ncbi:hypothetical protein S7335_2868 [Synechococcus sp. PCC 7335]|uniref:PRC-barrel domain-containing protein n=1 Tax=Synechococcus sp. (strain ATCC 29403 / PCC 7335) TaxID=91464 RepID=UPI00017EE386|nr:PRC-barrel domain-containing protein [Synechococcus sp. PCC 7335]EDX85169.1 hypothetical protein S7335_2868 [Synechococcus sp. PCC 7335]